MVRTTKRKSESALQTGKSKQRKTSEARRQDSDSSQRDGDSSDQLFLDDQPVAPKYVKKAAPKSRKSEPVMRVTKDDEYEEDDGRMESQQFLALVEEQTKKKRKAAKAASEYMGKFTNDVNNAVRALQKRREALSAASAKLDDDFEGAFKNAYVLSRPTESSSGDDSFSVRYERSKQITAYAHNIIERFEKDNEETVKINMTGLMTKDWDEEYSTAAKVMEAGRNAGLHKYEALAEGVGEPELDEENAGWVEMIYKPDQEIRGVGWGRMARKQDKALKKVDKNLAREIVV